MKKFLFVCKICKKNKPVEYKKVGGQILVKCLDCETEEVLN